ncbi:hypothetical protein GQ57_13590 [Burkholderia sp. MSh2]|uniref:Lipoprotein n=1 Tax=Burkholderia paludis TaxID=1506587 RepID=A0A6P2MKC2_9BURK|nr:MULTISPECIES: hypothetical protein [Burkholderia]KEZ05330.1 hypothetical protein GQ57_13590 [Burkholderia sp. MSh2]KFG97013.1 hypothetical protein GQ56_0112005 [Burkholderia paludis]CAB3761330.1 hypothetical protein LMG30113_03909 [Burkholderia paludis]VWB80835.1 hypothetical protein BPA30113_03704 [Burkholderia paludis]
MSISRSARAAVLSLLAAAGVAHAAPLTPEQTVDLYIGAFVNGDMSKARAFNDAVRASYGGKDALDVDVLSKLGESLRKNLASGVLASMPPKVGAALRPSAETMAAAYQRAINRSACEATGASQRPNPAVAGATVATVEFACRVANAGPGGKALEARLGPDRRLKNDAARIAAFKAVLTGLAQVLDDAPVTLPVTGKIDVYSLDGGWTTGSPEDVLMPVIDALRDSMPDGAPADR